MSVTSNNRQQTAPSSLLARILGRISGRTVRTALGASAARVAALEVEIRERSKSSDELRSDMGALAGRVETSAAKLDVAVAQIEASLETAQTLAGQLDRATRLLDGLTARHAALEAEHDQLRREAADVFLIRAAQAGPAGVALAGAREGYLTRRGADILVAAVSGANLGGVLSSGDIGAIVEDIAAGRHGRIVLVLDPAPADRPAEIPADELAPLIRDMPLLAKSFFLRTPRIALTANAHDAYRRILARLRTNPALIDFAAASEASVRGAPAPFAQTPPALWQPQLRKRSALFLHNNYYHYNVMAAALRKRGWDAITVSIESPDSPQRQFFHGEDVNLHHDDPAEMARRTAEFFAQVPERFESLHFYGRGYATFFASNVDASDRPTRAPWDFFELRRSRVVVGYMPSGCLDGPRQSEIRRATGGLCARCVWENRPDVCSDARNTAWTEHFEAVCDWVGVEGDWVVGARCGPQYVRGPVVTALDPDLWRLDLPPGEDLLIRRADPREVIVLHAVGNSESRRGGGRDIKGTGAVFAAIEKLQAEGLPVRLAFHSKVPSARMKEIQIQADIVVDQLHYGRYGAFAREAMMLGRPVVGRVDPTQIDVDAPARHMAECPILDAGVETVADVLRALVVDPRARERAGRASRSFALRWHAGDVCAERYERVVDRVRAGLRPDSPDLYPTADVVEVRPPGRGAAAQG